MQNFKMIAKTQLGLEEVLAEELRQLGAQEVTVLNRAVSFVGDLGFMYKAKLCLRTAIRILQPIHQLMLEEMCSCMKKQKFEWDQYIDVNNTLL